MKIQHKPQNMLRCGGRACKALVLSVYDYTSRYDDDVDDDEKKKAHLKAIKKCKTHEERT
ncbi:CLUMA_CG019797, isoform A [Clunio marinus]|uniref:CLUMA_CG019797, isoform A n=1 Tax=Clunio marinus TaxID=568069 RepID=A0A1J1J2M2_9DIPT|nr:CLUMA_CG019797, isoform A [Clunio marinus]